MKKVLKTIIKNRKITLLFVFVILIAGIFNYYVSPKQESPDFSIPYAMITTVYPGASQEDVDIYITSKIEDSLKQIDGYNTCFSYNSSSLSLIILELDFNANRDKAFAQLDKKMSDLQSELPEQAFEINVNTNIANEAGVILSLSSESYNHEQLNTYALELSSKLSSLDGVKKFETKGLLKQEVIIEINQEKLSLLELSLNDVVNIVKINNIDMPVGKIGNESHKIPIGIDETYKSIDDIKNTIVGYNSLLNKTIILEDIANIHYEQKANETYYIYNDSNTILIVGYFNDNQNILLVGNQIRDEIENFSKEIPNDIQLKELLFQPEEVDDSINTFMINLLISIILVVLVVLIGMGFKNAIIISISIPMSILISFTLMRVFGIVIHQISIAALVISLGMLVDNAIVISDSIQGYIDKGEKKMKACIDGSREVAIPIFTSTLTTIAAFTPFLFLNSIAGDYIKALPQIVIITLLASYFVAVFVIPVFAYMFFTVQKKNEKKHYINMLFTKTLKKAMNAKWLVIVIIIVALAITAYLAVDIDKIFFPNSDKDIIYIDILNNNSDDIDSTYEISNEVASILNNEDSINYFVTAIGGGVPRFNRILLMYSEKPDVSQIMIKVDLENGQFETNSELVEHIQNKIDLKKLDAKVVVKQLMYAFPMDEDIKIRISGDDIKKVKQHEIKIFETLLEIEGVTNVNKSNANYITEYEINIDNEKIAIHGINMYEIQNELSIATLGRRSGSIIKEGFENTIIVKCDIQTIDDIYDINIKSKTTNEYVKMSELVNINEIEKISTILKDNGKYSLAVTADYNLDYDKNESLEKIENSIDALNIVDCEIEYDGEAKTISENFGQIAILGIIALIFVFLILLVQFKSYLQPLIIFITIPLSVIGSIVGLYVANQPISFTALLGIVSLLGIVVNNAIILIDYINRQLKNNVKLKKACINATSRRLRPIFLSTITTMIGLIPLAIGSSQLFKPLAIALISGLFVSTLLTLIVIPVFVSMGKKRKI